MSGKKNIVIADIRDKLPTHLSKKYLQRELKDIKKIILHCDDLDKTVYEIAEWDLQPNPISSTGCPSITYSYFIEKDGKAYYSSDVRNITWHVGNHNKESLAICLQYKATGNPNPPPVVQLEAAYDVITRLCLWLGVEPTSIFGHRELKGTGWFYDRNGKVKYRKSCPGWKIDLDKDLRYNVTIRCQEALNKFGAKLVVDGVWGSKSSKAFKKFKKGH